MAEGTIRVGIGGWTYPPWRGVFYPDKLAAGEGARICLARTQRDRDQCDLLRPPKPEKLGSLGERRPRRLPVRRQRIALLRDPFEARRGGPRGSAISSRKVSRRSGPSSDRSCGCSHKRRKFDREDIAGFLDLLPREAGRHARSAMRSNRATRASATTVSSSSAGTMMSRSFLTMTTNSPAIDADTAELRLRTAAANERGR